MLFSIFDQKQTILDPVEFIVQHDDALEVDL